MMTPVTQSLINELRKLEAKATPGPWQNTGCDAYPEISIYRRVDDGEVSDGERSFDSVADDFMEPKDAAFCVASRNHLKDLCDALEDAMDALQCIKHARLGDDMPEYADRLLRAFYASPKEVGDAGR